ncbi:hypothetical protein DLAC_04827 [Tieghemostelium lacteum]|uniref:Uncharacterized protein n=1 Tax=Tieghemostelium lacteum TaxID=361077 RepID=A0A151ZJ79_TIELA|nr:hypothetical protein DLAC_04827 [Tieghemostelium lacteum]|eukprot:KYQ93940.1 hypothetical protein DLAC_04827 [Tieghemostelium lacteum]
MTRNNSSVIIRPYFTKDKDFLSKICRLPINSNILTLQAYSICQDYSVRRSMCQNGYIYVAEDEKDSSVVGGICVYEKKLRFDGKDILFFYPFDAIVDQRYRNLRILQRLADYATDVYLKHSDMEPIIYSSTLINSKVDRFYSNSSMVQIVEQVQHAWKVDFKYPYNGKLLSDSRFKMWIERDPEHVKTILEKYFYNYQMVPTDFDELIKCKFWKYTWFAEFKEPGKEPMLASISIWDQNKVCNLVKLDGNGADPSRRSKFLQLFACFTNQSKDSLSRFDIFKELLIHVHNESLGQGVDYLFIGLAKTDPIEPYFPLLPGIKSLPFALHFCIGGHYDREQLLEIGKDKPFFQDPRDYGIILLHKDSSSSGNDPLLFNSPISSKL